MFQESAFAILVDFWQFRVGIRQTRLFRNDTVHVVGCERISTRKGLVDEWHYNDNRALTDEKQHPSSMLLIVHWRLAALSCLDLGQKKRLRFSTLYHWARQTVLFFAEAIVNSYNSILSHFLNGRRYSNSKQTHSSPSTP
jgi:hypothetical protein